MIGNNFLINNSLISISGIHIKGLIRVIDTFMLMFWPPSTPWNAMFHVVYVSFIFILRLCIPIGLRYKWLVLIGWLILNINKVLLAIFRIFCSLVDQKTSSADQKWYQNRNGDRRAYSSLPTIVLALSYGKVNSVLVFFKDFGRKLCAKIW